MEKRKNIKENIKKITENIMNISFKKGFTLIAVILIVIFCISITPKTFQNDTYYTIEIGEYISENGIDMMDPFSWHEDLEYTYPHWLYDYITFLVYNSFGFNGVYILTAILASILGLAIFIANKKVLKNKLLAFIITIVTIYLLGSYIAARAQLVTFILFILTIYCIESFLENRKKKYAIFLIIIPILIANLHLAVFPFYFVLFLPYIAQYLFIIYSENIIFRKRECRILKRKIKKIEKIYDVNNIEIINKKDKLVKMLNELEENIEKRKLKRSEELKNSYKIRLEKNDNVKYLILIVIIAAFTGLLTPLRNYTIYILDRYNGR